MKIIIPDLEISYTSAAAGACLGAIASIGNSDTNPIKNIVRGCVLGFIFPFTVVNLYNVAVTALEADATHEIVRIGTISIVIKP